MLQRTTNSGHNVGLATTSINGFEKKKLSNDVKNDDESFGKKTLNCYHLQKKHSGNLLKDLLKIVCAGGDDAWDQYDY